MPYVLISTQIRLENGPTIVGDEWTDVELMEYLGANLCKQLGNNYLEYRTPDPPRIVLNKLEARGYTMTGMTGVGQTCIWTMYKPVEKGSVVQNENEITSIAKNRAMQQDTQINW